jgi:glycosyltransferase involved in cell wall biosynthesis
MKNYADANLHNASSIKQSAVIYPIILKNDVTLPEDREPGTYVTLVNGNMLKGVDIFLRIANKMKDTQFLGIRPYYRHVNVHDTDNVTWESYTDDVRKVLAKTRVLIVASYTESWSRIAFEAMYNGIPVVYSRPYESSSLPGGTTHAMKEWIEDGAIDVNRSSIDEWVAAIELLKDPDTYAEWSKKASEQSRKINVFSMVDAYENFLRDFSTKYKSGVTVSARAPQKSSGAPPAEPPRLPTMGVIPRMSFSGGRFGRKK